MYSCPRAGTEDAISPADTALIRACLLASESGRSCWFKGRKKQALLAAAPSPVLLTKEWHATSQDDETNRENVVREFIVPVRLVDKRVRRASRCMMIRVPSASS
jgi:hypothetical protein